MADEKKGEKKGMDFSKLNPNTLIFGALGIGIIALGWKLLSTMSQNTEAAKALEDDVQTEAEEAITYTNSGNATRDGLDIRGKSLDAKVVVAETMGKSVLDTVYRILVDTPRAWGLYVIIPYGAIKIGGTLLSWFLWKKKQGPPPGGFRCDKDGQTFSTEEELRNHINVAHVAETNAAALQAAQAIFIQQPEWVQNAVAAESALYLKVHNPWETLSAEEIKQMSYGMETAAAYAAGAAAIIMILRALAMVLIVI